MIVITKRAYNFVEWEITEVNGEKTAKAKNSFVVRPSAFPQIVPDWIQHDELFSIAQKDGNLKVVTK